jgi:hypothetical protein
LRAEPRRCRRSPRSAARSSRPKLALADSPDARRAYFIGVLPGYFRALGTPLREGREIAASDAAGAPEVIVVNRTLARRLYGAGSASARRIRLQNPEYGRGWRTVVGSWTTCATAASTTPARPRSTRRSRRRPFLWSYVMVRSAGPPMALAAAVRDAVRSVDPGLEAAAVKPMSDVIAETVAQPRFNVLLLSAFALLALLLAAVGIYGVVSYSVVQRTREIGVRMALGATRGDVLRLVTGEGVRMAALGVAIGLLGAVACARLLTALLFEVKPTDAATYLSAALFLVLVAAAASVIPPGARRASRRLPRCTRTSHGCAGSSALVAARSALPRPARARAGPGAALPHRDPRRRPRSHGTAARRGAAARAPRAGLARDT